MRAITLPEVSAEAINRIEAMLPPYFPRTAVADVTNGLFTVSFIETEMHRGRGPVGHQIGKKCVIFKEDFVTWLRTKYLGEEDNGNNFRDGAVPQGYEGTAACDGKASEGNEGD